MYKKVICGVLCILLFCIPVRAEELSLSSVSAVVMEAESGEVLYAKDPHTARPMASTTKLMTALLAAEQLPLDKEITVTPEAVAVEGSALGLRAGDTITLSDLLTGLLLVSGNDAANVTAQAVAGDLPAFASLMNAKAAALNMRDSGFVTPSGLDAEGHAASAHDMALLGCAVLRNSFLREVCATKSTQISFGNPKRQVWVSNHNRLLKLSADCIGLKTGFTKKSGRCLVSAAQRDGVTIVAATLNGGDYWNDHMKLYTYAFSQLERVQLLPPTLQPLAVAGGDAEEVALTTMQPQAVTLKKSDSDEAHITVQLPAFVWAPIEAGDSVGTVTYHYGEDKAEVLPITATESIAARPRASFYSHFFKNLKEMVLVFFQ